MHSRFLLFFAALSLLWAQAPTAPVIDPRGLINAFTQRPAPATVARGGILQITGLNLAPPEGASAQGAPLPAQLADVRVLINGTAAPLYSVSPGKILAQVPMDATTGVASVVVERASGTSAPAHVTIVPMDPAVRTADGSGFGQPWGTQSGQALNMSMVGLGTGDAPLTAFIGGIRTTATAAASASRPGEFDVQVAVPAGAQPGDLIQLLAGSQTASDQPTFQTLNAPTVEFVPLPGGAPQIAQLLDTDMDGNYLVAVGAQDASGCYPALAFDMLTQTAGAVAPCLAAAGAQGAQVLVRAGGGDSIAAMVGPPPADTSNGVSSTVQIFAPGRDPVTATLPSAAMLLASAGGGDLLAVLPGTPLQIYSIDGVTGDVTQGGAGRGFTIGGPAGAASVNVDGLTHVLATAAIGGGRRAVIVADDADKPTVAEVAVIRATGDIGATQKFPAGWLPLLGAMPPARPGGGGGAGGTGPGAGAFALARGNLIVDASANLLYALARASDSSKDALLAFAMDGSAPTVYAFPDGWFAPSCTAAIRIYNMQLSQSLVLLGTNVAETSYKTACPALGFLEFDLGARAFTATPLGGQASVNASTAGMVNDYVYATDMDQRGAGTTVFVLDGVAGSSFALPLPAGFNTFRSLRAVAEISSLVADGDQGLLTYDLDNEAVAPLGVPAGFASVAEVGVLPATRKLVARADNGPHASQLVIYNLLSANDFTVVPNPDGVSAVGAAVAAASATGANRGFNLPPRVNANANTVSAVGLDAAGNQVGVLVVRVP